MRMVSYTKFPYLLKKLPKIIGFQKNKIIAVKKDIKKAHEGRK